MAAAQPGMVLLQVAGLTAVLVIASRALRIGFSSQASQRSRGRWDVTRRSGEELVRLSFTLIEADIFPAPAWLMRDDPPDVQDLDHALRIAERHRVNVECLQTAVEKLAYLAGTLDSEEMIAGLSGASPK